MSFHEEDLDIAEQMRHPLITKDGGCDLKIEKQLSIKEENSENVYNFKCYKSPQGDEKQLEKIRIELTRESDIYYVAMCEITSENFSKVIDTKKVKSNFRDFIATLNKVLENVQTNRTVFSAELAGSNSEESEDNLIKLVFKQKLQFKTVTIFELKFNIMNREDQYVIDQAQFRFDWKDLQLESAKDALKQLYRHVESQNKTLYSQLKRGQEFSASRKL